MALSFIHRWSIVGMCLSLSGCTVCENFMRTTHWEPAEFSAKHDRHRSLAVYRSWGEQAWLEECHAAPELAERADYGAGFVDGFADYVYGGGNGEPPPVPPRRLWNVYFRSEEGHQRAADWFAGYRHGAQFARDGGYRELSTIRSSLFGFEGNEAASPDRSGIRRSPASEYYEDLPTGEALRTPDLSIPTVPSDPAAEVQHEKLSEPAKEDVPSQEQTDPPSQPQPPRDMLPENLLELDLPAENEAAPPKSIEHAPEATEAPPTKPEVPPPQTLVPQADRAPERIPLIIFATANDSNLPAMKATEPAPTSSSVRLVSADSETIAIPTEPPLQVAPSPPTLFPTPNAAVGESDRKTTVLASYHDAAISVEAAPMSSMPQATTIEIRQGSNALRNPIVLKPDMAEANGAR